MIDVFDEFVKMILARYLKILYIMYIHLFYEVYYVANLFAKTVKNYLLSPDKSFVKIH